MMKLLARLVLLNLLLALLIGGSWVLFLKQPPPTLDDYGPVVVIVHSDSSEHYADLAYLFDPTQETFRELGDADFAIWSPKGSYLATMSVDPSISDYWDLSIWDPISGKRHSIDDRGSGSTKDGFLWSLDEGYLVTNWRRHWGLYGIDVWSGDGEKHIWRAIDTTLISGIWKDCYRPCSPIRWDGDQLIIESRQPNKPDDPLALWSVDIPSNAWTLLEVLEPDTYLTSADPRMEVDDWWTTREAWRATSCNGLSFAIERDRLIVREDATGWRHAVLLPFDDGSIEYVIWSPAPYATLPP